MPHIADKAANGRKPGDRIEAAEEFAGYKLQDPLGRKIGNVEKLFVNRRGEPEYIRVKMGLLGLKSALIPVQFVEVQRVQRIIVPQ